MDIPYFVTSKIQNLKFTVPGEIEYEVACFAIEPSVGHEFIFDKLLHLPNRIDWCR